MVPPRPILALNEKYDAEFLGLPFCLTSILVGGIICVGHSPLEERNLGILREAMRQGMHEPCNAHHTQVFIQGGLPHLT